ncbi:MAG: hypothetical protein QM786_19025 [Breznakibacter sp.]
MTLIICVSHQILQAQTSINQTPVGIALAGCDAASARDLCLLANPGNLALAAPRSATLFFENRYALKELSTKGLAFAYSGKYGSAGVVLANFGFDVFRTSRYGLAYGRSFANKKVSAGFQLNMHDDYQAGAGHFTTLFSNVGAIYQVSSRLLLGVHCCNPEQATVKYPGFEMALPTYFELGGNWQLFSHTRVLTEVEQYVDLPIRIGFGIESSIDDKVFLRGGYRVTDNEFSWGMGARFGNLSADCGFAYQMPLGLVSMASVLWNFTPKSH